VCPAGGSVAIAPVQDWFTLIKVCAVEISETVIFVALVISLTVHTIKWIVNFGRGSK